MTVQSSRTAGTSVTICHSRSSSTTRPISSATLDSQLTLGLTLTVELDVLEYIAVLLTTDTVKTGPSFNSASIPVSSLSVVPPALHLSTAFLRPVHTGDYSRRFRRQFVAENCDCRQKRRLSPNGLSTLATIVANVDRPLQIRSEFRKYCSLGLYLE